MCRWASSQGFSQRSAGSGLTAPSTVPTSSEDTAHPCSKAVCFLSFASLVKYFRMFYCEQHKWEKNNLLMNASARGENGWNQGGIDRIFDIADGFFLLTVTENFEGPPSVWQVVIHCPVHMVACVSNCISRWLESCLEVKFVFNHCKMSPQLSVLGCSAWGVNARSLAAIKKTVNIPTVPAGSDRVRTNI